MRSGVWVWCMVMVLMHCGEGTAVFNPSPYFAAYQVRLAGAKGTRSYSFPNHGFGEMSFLGLALSGYDFREMGVVQFQSQVSYDPSRQMINIVLSLYNNTQFYFLNYFVLTVSANGSAYFGVISACMAPNANPYDEFCNGGTASVQVTSPFTKNESNSIVCIPMLKSIQSVVFGQYSYFNVTYASYLQKGNQVTVQVFNNYTLLIEACVTVVVYLQSQAVYQLFLTTALSSSLSISSDASSTSLGSVAGNAFGINYMYGPVYEPKCFIGIQNFFLKGKVRQTLNYNLSQNGVSQVYASSEYEIGYVYFCIADIACSGSNRQYYPAIGDCEQRCAILNCSLCSSSTSCLICQPTYFINSLFRCSACPPNCLNCTTGNTCITCIDGHFLNSSTCQVCPLFCLKCTSQVCTSCQSGYIPVGNGCLACGSAMPNCLTCSAGSICTLCVQTYYFNSNMKGCVVCNVTIPNCRTCNLPNNCLTCYPGFYLAGINKCSPCMFNINACCPLYVDNCSICKSNRTCSVCAPSFYLTSNLSCSSCAVFGSNCVVCNANACVQCLSGYYPANSTCILCSSVLPNCAACTNGSVCSTCQNGMIVVNDSCYNCPFWPVNQLFFLDQQNQCQGCDLITDKCQTCTSNTTCLSCFSLYYLANNACYSCAESIAQCSACSNSKECEICESGSYLSLDKTQCLPCSSTIAHCGQCGYISVSKSSVLSCQICDPQYFANNSVCTSCDSSIPFCLQCSSPTVCTLCASNYFLDSTNLCVDCPAILQGCLICVSASQCSSCASSYYLQNGYCMQCNISWPNCLSCIKNGTLMACTKCQDSYFFDSTMSCSSCAIAFSYCSACTINACSSCIPGYYPSQSGICKACGTIVPNCIYCLASTQCLICNTSFWLNSASNRCDTCNNISKGCASCQRLSNMQMNCTSCLTGYALYGSSGLLFSCLSCGVTIMNCLACSSSSLCSLCTSTSFLNQYGTCSLCSLYISNCETCSNASQCTQCKKTYQVIANGTCFYCDLARFGVDSAANPLCTVCNFQGGPVCSTCTSGYFVSSTQTQCLPCGKSILNCAQCVSDKVCLSCSAGYALSSDNFLCFACGIANCKTCFNSVCTECSSDSYMMPGTSNCQLCNSMVGGCDSCDSGGCLGCTDGYYFQGGSCVTCSSAIPDCILCSSKAICDLKFTPSVPEPESPLLKPLAIAFMVLSLVLLTGLIIWWRLTFRKAPLLLQQQGAKADTDRKITHDQVYTNEIELDKGKICQYCLTNSSQIMRIQLLCSKCELKLKRGHKHKIRKEIAQRSREDINPYEMKLYLESNIDPVLQVSKQSTQKSKRQEQSRFQQASSRKAATKATDDMESQAIRNMF